MMLSDKNIIITGAGRGIGRQLAVKCAEKGANIIAIARTENKLKETIKIIEKYNKNSGLYIADISDKDEVKDTFNKILKHYTKIDCLINNAGIQPPIGPFVLSDLNKWKYNIEVNLMGTVYCTFEVLKNMKLNGAGKIINLSGGGSTSPRPSFSAYAVAKTAIVRFTEILAEELKEYKIHVNAVSPGAINTGMLDEVLKEGEKAGQEFYEAVKRKENGGDNPDLAAGLVCFLASDLSDGITGKLISAKWDPWRDKEFQDLLKNDKDIASLRRIDNKYFYKKL